MSSIVWFRQDLRCQDNPALSAACLAHEKIIPLYIKPPAIGAAQSWWLHHSLLSLANDLKPLGLNLCLRQGSALDELNELIEKHSIDTIYWNRCYEPDSIARDTMIKESLQSRGLTVKSFNSTLLHEPWEVLTQSRTYFKVFTPYWRQCLRQIKAPSPISHIKSTHTSPTFQSDSLTDWNLLPINPNWAIEFSTIWQPGESGAHAKLEYFISHFLKDYKRNRDEPAKSGTSHLSPHLHFGEISPWKLWEAVQRAKLDPRCDLTSADHFLSELGWRDFSYQLLYHYPLLPTTNFKSAFNHFPWKKNDVALTAWKKGLTGYPIVDAGMRELWRTGYMHNRVRMIVASFLVKHLLIDWREGAEWFMDTLLDADLASNSASWQWVAGSGADAAPYFRIFNPILQGEKFDPQGEYVKRWVPELKNIPNKWIHKPWETPKNQLSITLGKDYPLPIVDHAAARVRALVSYQELRI